MVNSEEYWDKKVIVQWESYDAFLAEVIEADFDVETDASTDAAISTVRAA